jgi:NAD(P)H dehydrogenase (quinone)
MIAGCFALFCLEVIIILGSELSMKCRELDMVEVLVLYYSRTGRTEALVKAIVEGVESVKGASAKMKRVNYATVNDFISCDAIAFGSPNYFSYMAGVMKDFFDKALSIRERVAGKPSVAFTSGGGQATRLY